MGPGEEDNTPPNVEIQEGGDIYFFYRPKVGKEEPHSSDDVQRMYIVLRPHTQPHEEKSTVLRLIVMGRKRLPDPAKRSKPYWGFVELVTTNIQDIKDALKGAEYETKTRGHRHKPAARALGEGVYRILRHHTENKMHTHLIYKLEFPSSSEGTQNQPQEELNVETEGSFVIQIKNPAKTQGRRQTSSKRKKKASIFPAHLQGLFGKLRYHAADPSEFLNYSGCEFLLVSASDDIHKELGLDVQQDASCSDLVNTFGKTTSADALFRGIWV